MEHGHSYTGDAGVVAVPVRVRALTFAACSNSHMANESESGKCWQTHTHTHTQSCIRTHVEAVHWPRAQTHIRNRTCIYGGTPEAAQEAETAAGVLAKANALRLRIASRGGADIVQGSNCNNDTVGTQLIHGTHTYSHTFTHTMTHGQASTHTRAVALMAVTADVTAASVESSTKSCAAAIHGALQLQTQVTTANAHLFVQQHNIRARELHSGLVHSA